MAGRGIAPTAAKPRFSGVYVVVLPAPEHESAGVAYSYTSGCGLDRSTGEVYSCSPEYDDCLAYRRVEMSYATRVPPIPPVRMKLATHDATLSSQGDSRDCLSGYDRAYDAIVYGDHPLPHEQSDVLSAGDLVTVIRPSDLEWNEQQAVFRSLLGTPIQRAAKPADWRRRAYNARALWMGIENAVLRLVNRGGWLNVPAETGAPITWDDYIELTRVSGNDAPLQAVRAESPTPVQSGQALLRFAAAGMNTVGDLLSTVAAGMERLAEDGRVATQPGQSQR